MGLSESHLITADANAQLARLAATGQVDYVYAYNPTDSQGCDRHVLMYRDTPDDPAPARHNLSTKQFQHLLSGTTPWTYRDVPARGILRGDVTRAWTALAHANMGAGRTVRVDVELHGGFGQDSVVYRDPDALVSVWERPVPVVEVRA